MLIYVKSEAAANRVIKSFSNYLEKKLKLVVNATKSKVARPNELKYLGFGFKKSEGKWKATIHEKSKGHLEEKIMKLTKRNWSISLTVRIEKINKAVSGWCNYFRCAWIAKTYLRKLDEKLRRRLRTVMWKQWKSIKKKERELISLGCDPDKAHSYACARQKYVRCARTFLNRFIRISVLKSMGLQAVEDVLAKAADKFTREIRTNRPVPNGTLGGVRGT